MTPTPTSPPWATYAAVVLAAALLTFGLLALGDERHALLVLVPLAAAAGLILLGLALL